MLVGFRADLVELMPKNLALRTAIVAIVAAI